MAPEIEISAPEAQSVRDYAKHTVERGNGVVIEKTVNAAGPLMKFRVGDEEFRLFQVWHFDDEISDHLEAFDSSIADLREQGILEIPGDKVGQIRREKDADHFTA